MKKIFIFVFIHMFFMASQCFSGDGINLEDRTRVDPRTGDLIIDLSPRDRDEINYQKSNPASDSPGPATPSITDQSTEGRESINVNTGESIIDIGGGESINVETGDRIIDLGGGESINVDTGERILDIGDGEKINLDTGGRIIEVD